MKRGPHHEALARSTSDIGGAIDLGPSEAASGFTSQEGKDRNETFMAFPQPREAIHHPETHGNTPPKRVQGQQNTRCPQMALEQRGPQTIRPTRGQPARGNINGHRYGPAKGGQQLYLPGGWYRNKCDVVSNT
jgi:hypothetical protein